MSCRPGLVAQLVEHLLDTQVVASSILAGATNTSLPAGACLVPGGCSLVLPADGPPPSCACLRVWLTDLGGGRAVCLLLSFDGGVGSGFSVVRCGCRYRTVGAGGLGCGFFSGVNRCWLSEPGCKPGGLCPYGSSILSAPTVPRPSNFVCLAGWPGRCLGGVFSAL